MHHLVNARAREIPAAEAVCAWDGRLTYRQLDLLSETVAQRLVRLGVGPGVYVPFAYEKSMWTVVATLGILKAGGAFVPLNLMDPIARLRERVKDVAANVIVTMGQFVHIFMGVVKHVEVVSAETIAIEGIDRTLSSNGALNGIQPNGIKRDHTRTVGSNDPIFVLFTSGSTGKPKGMIHEHGAICTHAVTHGESMGYSGARVLQFAAHTFDVAIIDMFTTLIFGGCICIPSEEDRKSNIVGVINSMKVDYTLLTPSFAGLIDPSEVPTLRTLAIGGEALPQDRIERWADKVRFIQVYGPAEVGICLSMDMQLSTSPETVGYPLSNSSCWLVDPDDVNRLVPLGAIGELVVAGPSLARGYLGNETKTQSTFVGAPAWAQRMGLRLERFMKTGDLLRYNVDSMDGCYDFIGRKDSQIKLRGQRIEPGEVEYHIGRLTEVAVSMVTWPKEGCFAKELVLVVQMQRTGTESFHVRNEPIRLASVQSLSIEIVRTLLSKVLPNYMIPTVCLVVDSMPLVPSLKIDRRQVTAWLETMESRPASLGGHVLSALDPVEVTANAISLKVAEFVARKDITTFEVLERHDFRLQAAGIDSVQIISLSMFLQREYGTKIPMNTLLDSKLTIRELANLVDGDAIAVLNGGCNYLPAALKLPASIDILHESESLCNELKQSLDWLHLDHHVESSSDASEHGPITNTFLTGATGYLGSAILQQLMAMPKMHVHALVRCHSGETGLERITAAAITNGWWHESYKSRIHIWQGDLDKPSLALRESQIHCLSGTNLPRHLSIHAIIHNGAKVHYSSDYSTLKATNILSTISLLKLTASAPHISSFCFVSGGEKPSLDTSSAPPSYFEQLNQASGYTQTKFLSEQIVRSCVSHAAFKAKRVNIVKPGYIIGSVENGIANQSDFLWRLVAGCVEIAAYDRDESADWLFVAGVDRVARSAVSGVFVHTDPGKVPVSGRVDRVLDGLCFSDLWILLEEEFGYRFEALAHDEWLGKLRSKVVESGEGHLLFPLLHVLEKDGGRIGEEKDVAGGFPSWGVREAVGRNVRHLIDIGFLPRSRKEVDLETNKVDED